MLSRTAIIALFASAATAATVAVQASNYGDVTYYTPGLGACGQYNTDTDYIVAVAAGTFDNYPGATSNPNNNPICGKQIKVNYQGKSVTVTVVDRCAGCAGAADLDLSPTAFSQLANESVGRLYNAEWDYV
ncbi:hypothetical protein PILCRDRAFT_740461 [Piloderma croceum F 1598]|uniref:RlpA-like protein double-psi beta-barrel domain-containing protein n=1 Tax=Piloderma croceum (strain F 1598) TaxID=765440 RepID=A0A0C3B5B5_PILCF|nr:hypothetical protein PILCRDRAFT_740461 [Piloderma croceum F 1598]